MIEVGHSGVLELPSSQAADLKPSSTQARPGKEACADAPPLLIIKRLKACLCLHNFMMHRVILLQLVFHNSVQFLLLCPHLEGMLCCVLQ